MGALTRRSTSINHDCDADDGPGGRRLVHTKGRWREEITTDSVRAEQVGEVSSRKSILFGGTSFDGRRFLGSAPIRFQVPPRIAPGRGGQ
jgi:hypothetical protein